MNKHIKYIIEKNYTAFNPAKLEDDKPKQKLPQDVVKQILYLKAKNPENLREHIKYLFDLGIKDLNCIDVSSIVDFSNLFKEMRNLQDLQIDEWDVSSGKIFTSMFEGCKDFNSDISKWNMCNAEQCYNMFNGCHRFNCDLSGWKLPKLRDATNMFANCTDFNADLSDWRLPNVYDVTYMFANCKKFDKSCVEKWGISTRTQGYYSMG